MKNFTLLAAFLLFAGMTFGQTGTRQVLIEEFTQASCGPCASQNPALNTKLNTAAAYSNNIKYQVWWPGYDPMYEHNEPDVDGRKPTYNFNGVPTAMMDGVLFPNDCNAWAGAPNCLSDAEISAAAAVPSPIEMNVTYQWMNTNLDSIEIDVTITNTNGGAPAGATSNVLHVVIVEKEINFTSPPGSTSEKDFYNVMKKMLPDFNGTSIGQVMAGGQTKNFKVAVPTYMYRYDQLAVIAWVQDATNAVHNSAYADPVAFPPGVTASDLGGAKNTTVSNSSYCFDLTPAMTITNNGPSDVTAGEGYYQINGGNKVTKPLSATLTATDSELLTFPTVTLPAGNATVEYGWQNIVGGIDINTSNNDIASDSYVAMSASSWATSMSEGFENAPLISGTGYSLSVDHMGFEGNGAEHSSFGVLHGPAYNYGSIGGYGTSSRSVRVNVNQPNGRNCNLILDKLDLTAVSNPYLTFDHAYQQNAAESSSERLTVFASTDCGATWSGTLLDVNGADLATKTPGSNTIWRTPTGAEWTTDTVSLTEYANMDNVMIKVTVTTGGGNTMYMDNFLVEDVDVTGIREERAFPGSLSISPNPVQDLLKVKLQLDKSGTYSIDIFNATGQKVDMITRDTYRAGVNTIEVNTNSLPAGFYHIAVTGENGYTHTERFVK